MCRSIKTLREGTAVAAGEEIEAAALQFVRKVSGFQRPADHNREAFDRAVRDITRASERLLDDLLIAGRPTSRRA